MAAKSDYTRMEMFISECQILVCELSLLIKDARKTMNEMQKKVGCMKLDDLELFRRLAGHLNDVRIEVEDECREFFNKDYEVETGWDDRREAREKAGQCDVDA